MTSKSFPMYISVARNQMLRDISITCTIASPTPTETNSVKTSKTELEI